MDLEAVDVHLVRIAEDDVEVAAGQADFARSARALGVRYLGVCCGGGPHHVRAMAEALGRTPAASRYSPCMEKHDFFGDRGTANV